MADEVTDFLSFALCILDSDKTGLPSQELDAEIISMSWNELQHCILLPN